MTDYAGNVLGAIDLIVQERMKDLKFDKTIVCTIIENLGEGVYLVNDGSTNFEAVADILSYPIGYQVNVLVPQGDYNNQKTITGRYINKEKGVEGVRYMTPFDNCLDVTGNRITTISDTTEYFLIANGEKKEEIIWSEKLSGRDVSGYDYIGLSADFYAALSEFSPISGNYGLKLEISGTKKNSDNEFRPYEFKLDSSDMYGNPYLFETYFNQQKIFKIDDFKAINSIRLSFYQDANFEYEYELNGEIVKEKVPTGMGEGIYATEISPNLKAKNFYLFFGYALDKLTTDTVLLITTESEKYNHTEDIDANKRSMMVKWVRREGNTAYVMEEDRIDPSMRVHWYRYDKTFKEDPIAGDNWEELPNSWSKLKYENIPLRMREKGEEKFKVIITKGDIDETTTVKEEAGLVEKFESNELIFTSAVPIPDPDAVDRVNALKIVYANDNYQGKYRIYNEGKELKNEAEAVITRTLVPALELHGEPVEISKEDKVTWYVPKNATMIILAETDETAKIDREASPDYYIVTKSGENPFELNYKIKNLYLETNVNNTINCFLYRRGNGINYEASTTMTFGTTGTAGTDYTFVIEPVGSNGVYTVKDGKRLTFEARLYNYNDEPVEWQNESIRWEWAIDAKHAFTGIEESQDKKYVIGSSVTLTPDDVTYTTKDGKETFTPKESYPEGAERYSYNAIKATVTAHTAYKTQTPKMNENGDYLDKNNAIIKPDKNGEIDTSKIMWEDDEVEQEVEMSAYYSIPVRTKPEYYISGATSVWYDNAGTDPAYAKDKYEIFGITGDTTPVWEVIYKDPAAASYYPQVVSLKENEYTLRPKQMYIQDVPNTIAIKCYDKDDKDGFLWVQPLIIGQDKYGSTLLNQWDGSLTIDEKNGTILSTMVGAGVKNPDNTFSGVLMGDVENAASMNATGMGIYGFNHGEQSFNFSVDGTAFIGKSGRGRIIFNGNDGIIASQSYFTTENDKRIIGMKLDLNDGTLISSNTGGIVEIDPTNPARIFRVKDKDNTTIMLVGNTDYYLRSSNYDYKNMGTNFNLVNGNLNMANTGGWISITPSDKDALFTVRGKDYGRYDTLIDDSKINSKATKLKDDVETKESDTKTKILSTYYETYAADATQKELKEGTSYYYKITEVTTTIETGQENKISEAKPYYEPYDETLNLVRPVLYVMVTKVLLNVGNENYYLRSANYSSNTTGMRIKLDNGTIDAAGTDGSVQINPNSSSSIFTLKGKDENNKLQTLMQAGGGSYYLQSADYGSGDSTGLRIDLRKGEIKSKFFSLENNGTITATGGTIGGWTISSDSLSGSGKISGGSISGSTITGGSIDINSGTFSVDSSGNLTATSATIKGSISGSTISGSTISGGSISGSTITVGGFSVSSAGVISTNQVTTLNGFTYLKAGITYVDGSGLYDYVKGIALGVMAGHKHDFSGSGSDTVGALGGTVNITISGTTGGPK